MKKNSDVVLKRNGRVRSPKTVKRGALVGKDIKHRVQLGDLKKIPNFLRQVQQLQIPALIFHRRKPADQLADSRAVDVVHVSEIQKNHFPLIIQQSPDRLSQKSAAVSERNPSAQVHNGDLPGIAMRRME
jgi:hypothetical protein